MVFSASWLMIYTLIFDSWHFYQSVAKVNGAIGDLGKGFVVGDDDEGLAELVAEVKEKLVEFSLVFGVERAGRFVGQDDGGTVDEGAGHGDTLLFTTGEFVGLMGGTVCQSHEVEQFLGALFGAFLGESCDISWNHDVLNRRELW